MHKRFKLTFNVALFDGFTEQPTDDLERVIMAENLDQAKRIADAMLGEEARAQEHLNFVRKVVETQDEPDMKSFTPEKTWERTIYHLYLSETENAERILYNGKQVGISIKPI